MTMFGLKRLCTIVLAFSLCLALSGPVLSVEPDEVLDDPALEQRAREISAELRCMVCQNQAIDDSNAELARDLRILVRDRLRAGDTDSEVIDYVVARYGEFVLLKPRFSARNALLWGAPVLVLLGGGVLAFMSFRTRPGQSAKGALSPEEESELHDILNKRD